MKLLIVDDGHYVVEYLKHLLDWSKFGITFIETCTNSIKARERLDEGDIDILITDIRMPEVSGIDLLQRVKERGLGTRGIILSGYSQFEYAQQAIRLSAFDYLLKPVDKDDMEKAMRKLTRSLAAEAEAAVSGPGHASCHEAIPAAAATQQDAQRMADSSCSNSRLIGKVQAYISEHLEEGLSLEELAGTVHLHPVYLSKLYKQETGENLSGYIQAKRLEKASGLLLNSGLHVVDISRMVGYKKPQYFIKLFKTQYGITPYQYRRRQLDQSR